AAEPPPGRERRGPRRPVWAAAAALVVLVLAAWWLAAPGPQHGGPAGRTATVPGSVALGLGRPTAVVLPLAGDEDGRLAAALRADLAESFNVASSSAGLVIPANAEQAGSLLRTDLSIEGEVVAVQRHTGVRLHVYAGGRRRQVWADSVPTAVKDRWVATLAARGATALRHATGFARADDTVPGHFPLAPVQDDYLEGRMHLDRPTSELSVKRA